MVNNALVRVVIESDYPTACLTPNKLDRLRKKISKEIEVSCRLLVAGLTSGENSSVYAQEGTKPRVQGDGVSPKV